MPRAKQFDEEEILQMAMMLFWEKGYYDTSIKDLIAHLGISNASIYHSFGGKKQLFYKAFAYYRHSQTEGLKQFLSTQKDVRVGLTQAFQKIVYDDCTDDACKGCFIVNTSTELIPSDPAIQSVIATHQKRIESIFFDFLQVGIEAGQISSEKNTVMISQLLYTLMTGLRVVGKTKPNPDDLMASVKAVLSLLD